MTTKRDGGAILRELCYTAKKGGAEDVAVISADDIIIDPRVRIKCMIPPCHTSGACRSCPPYGYSIKEVCSMVSRYEKAIFFRVAADEAALTSPGIPCSLETGLVDNEGAIIAVGAYYLLCCQIVALMEKRARQFDCDPLGFTAGDCKQILCFFHRSCRALKDRSRCRHPDLSRPAMEASGMDVFAMAANVGWGIYPIGGSCRPGDVPRASICGIVLAY